MPTFGTFTFFAKKHPGELCGSNGLPLTPNSIIIYGRSQCLKNIDHFNLCEYLDVSRSKHERIIVSSEYFTTSLKDLTRPVDLTKILVTVKQILLGLNYLNSKGIVHRSLSPTNILLSRFGNVKLFNYGLYYMSNYGKCVSFPIGNPKYMAPEVLLNKEDTPSGPKVDVWSLGMILAELVLNKEFWCDLKLCNIIKRVLSLIICSGTVLEHLANEHGCGDTYKALPSDIKNLLNLCLTVDVKKRPTPNELLQIHFFQNVKDKLEKSDRGYHVDFLKRVPEENFVVKNSKPQKDHRIRNTPKSFFYKFTITELQKRDLEEIYHVWHLAGGDAFSELKKQGMIKNKPPVLSLPNLILLEGTVFGELKDTSSMLDLRVVLLPLNGLHHRLFHMRFEEYHPLIEIESDTIDTGKPLSKENFLPLVIREKNSEYQFHRIILFKRLLLAYPFTIQKIVNEANIDIPPLVRGKVWAALMGVSGDIQRNYNMIDKETPTPTDRQIEVDIPRCHQYNELLSSAEGHRKLKRILKAWVMSHSQYVYWQGLDSLCAPFLYLNFKNEALAFACFSKFTKIYLHDFFLKDNSDVIHEYLAKFRHLIAFHDPVLFNHLELINFIPELFAIPWFLTMFSHVFPLNKIFHLWDFLLLRNNSCPLFIGLAILNQLRDTLLRSGFNECILLFSDLPEIDIERCVKCSMKMMNDTPESISQRRHQPGRPRVKDPDLELSELSVAELQKECCPRISASNLISVIKSNEESKTKNYITIDIRSIDEYQRLSLPGSIHIPFNTISFSEIEIPKTKEGNLLLKNKGKLTVVIGSGGENLKEFCKWLVQCEFSRVCSLDGGIQVLQKTGILSTSGS